MTSPSAVTALVFPGTHLDTELLARSALSRLVYAEVLSHYQMILASLDHILVSTDYNSNIIHGHEQLRYRGSRYTERVAHHQCQRVDGKTTEVYFQPATDQITVSGAPPEDVLITVGDLLTRQVNGSHQETSFGLRYYQRQVQASVIAGLRVVTAPFGRASSAMVRLKKTVGNRTHVNFFQLLANGLLHLEHIKHFKAFTAVRQERIRLVMRNVGNLMPGSGESEPVYENIDDLLPMGPGLPSTPVIGPSLPPPRTSSLVKEDLAVANRVKTNSFSVANIGGTEITT